MCKYMCDGKELQVFQSEEMSTVFFQNDEVCYKAKRAILTAQKMVVLALHVLLVNTWVL